MTNHTTPHPPAEHPSPEELSALVDGELEPAGARQALEHVATCASCRDERLRFAEIRRLLSELETTAPAEAAADAVAAALSALERARAVEAALDLRRRGRRLRVAGIAAGLVLVAGVAGGIGVELVHTGSSSSATSALAPGRAQQALTTSLPAPTVIDFRASAGAGRFGPDLAELAPGDVARVRFATGPGGTSIATITLRPGVSVSNGLRGRQSVVAVLSGQRLGVARTAAHGTIEITGLTKLGAARLRQGFG
jgi:hypothetical protein